MDVLSCTRKITVESKRAFIEFINPLISDDYVDGGWAYITLSSKLYIRMGSEWLKRRYVQVREDHRCFILYSPYTEDRVIFYDSLVALPTPLVEQDNT